MGTHLLNEDRLSQAMRAAQNGDELAYKELLSGASPYLIRLMRKYSPENMLEYWQTFSMK